MTTETIENNMIRIIAFGRGFVIVGIIKSLTPDDGWLKVDYGVTIRKWGTKKGLGELCYGLVKHKDKQTIIDPIPSSIEIPIGSIHCMLKVEEKAWLPILRQNAADAVMRIK